MDDSFAFGEAVELPAPPAGWFEHRYALLRDGALALVRADRDMRAPAPDFRAARLRLSTFDGTAESGAVEIRAEPWPKVDRLADGRWLVVAPRAARDERNGRLFTPDGTPAGDMVLGDGIEHVRCAPDGTIWIGYFDEGVFSGQDVSASGITRFAPDGELLWRFDSAARDDLYLYDCYALTLDGNTLWSCFYGDFPIVRVVNGKIDDWLNAIAGACALAVEGDQVLLAGGYQDQAERLVLLRLDQGGAREIGRWRFPPLARDTVQLVQGQGSTLHVVGQGIWTRLSIESLTA